MLSILPDQVEIFGNLEEGEVLILQASEELAEGMKVNVEQETNKLSLVSGANNLEEVEV